MTYLQFWCVHDSLQLQPTIVYFFYSLEKLCYLFYFFILHRNLPSSTQEEYNEMDDYHFPLETDMSFD